MKKLNVLLLVFVFGLCSCKNEVSNLMKNEEVVFTDKVFANATESLQILAPVFSDVILSSDLLLKTIENDAKTMFDGDYDVLYEKAKNFAVEESIKNGRRVSKKTFSDCVEDRLKSKNISRSAAGEMIESVPYFNLFYYSPDYEKEFSADDVLVTYLDYTIPEEELLDLIGYDKNGNIHIISGLEPPEFPVIVLGINERMNYKGDMNVLEPISPEERSVSTFDGTYVHEESLFYIDYKAKYGAFDPWPRGYPEVYVIYVIGPDDIRQNYLKVDKPGKYNFSGNNVSIINFPENQMWKFFMYDEDLSVSDTTLSVTLTYPVGENGSISVTIPVTIGTGDDLMGSTMIDYNHTASGYTSSLGDVADISFKYNERKRW